MLIGKCSLVSTDEVLPGVEGKTVSGVASVGNFYMFQFTCPNKLKFKLAYVVWQNGERDVRPTSSEGPSVLDHLSSGRRRLTLAPLKNRRYYSVLKQARVKYESPNEWSGLFKATREELDAGCGEDVFEFLRESGALEVGNKEAVTGISDKQRSWPTALYSSEDHFSPVLAFILTRVIPLLNGYNPQLYLL